MTNKQDFITWLKENGISEELITTLDTEITEAVGTTLPLSVEKDTDPAWERRPSSTKDEILSTIGEEAWERLLERPTLEERLKAVEEVMNNPTSQGVNDLDAFMFEFLLDSIDISVKIGYALAITEGRLCDFEAWLQKAIVAAGLIDYKPDLVWDKPVNS